VSSYRCVLRAVVSLCSEPAAKLLASLRLQPTVENACLYDVNGNVLASYAKDPEKGSEAVLNS